MKKELFKKLCNQHLDENAYSVFCEIVAESNYRIDEVLEQPHPWDYVAMSVPDELEEDYQKYYKKWDDRIYRIEKGPVLSADFEKIIDQAAHIQKTLKQFRQGIDLFEEQVKNIENLALPEEGN